MRARRPRRGASPSRARGRAARRAVPACRFPRPPSTSWSTLPTSATTSAIAAAIAAAAASRSSDRVVLECDRTGRGGSADAERGERPDERRALTRAAPAEREAPASRPRPGTRERGPPWRSPASRRTSLGTPHRRVPPDPDGVPVRLRPGIATLRDDGRRPRSAPVDCCWRAPAGTAQGSSARSTRSSACSSSTARPSTCASRSCTTSTSCAASRSAARSSWSPSRTCPRARSACSRRMASRPRST